MDQEKQTHTIGRQEDLNLYDQSLINPNLQQSRQTDKHFNKFSILDLKLNP